MDTLVRIQQWYAAQCDGDWEHQCGVQIQSLDNPGWMVEVDIAGTTLEGKPFAEVAEGLDSVVGPNESRWICCCVRAATWQGRSDESQLVRLLELFLNWAETSPRRGAGV